MRPEYHKPYFSSATRALIFVSVELGGRAVISTIYQKYQKDYQLIFILKWVYNRFFGVRKSNIEAKREKLWSGLGYGYANCLIIKGSA